MAQSYAQTLLAKGRQEGRQEGNLAAKRDCVIMAITERFGEPPQAARSRINATSDTELLNEWMRRTLRAQSIDDLPLQND